MIAMFDGLSQLASADQHPFGVIIDVDGGLANKHLSHIPPLSYIPPLQENGHRAYLRIYPRGLVETVRNFRRSWHTIVRNASGVMYSADNPHPTTADVLFHYAVHELRHTLQAGLQIFTPDTVEKTRTFLSIALDIRKQHLQDDPEHYSQSGPTAVGLEFDAEVIAMYASSLWRQKEPQEIRAILLAEPA
jgi:hypothetical protein